MEHVLLAIMIVIQSWGIMSMLEKILKAVNRGRKDDAPNSGV